MQTPTDTPAVDSLEQVAADMQKIDRLPQVNHPPLSYWKSRVGALAALTTRREIVDYNYNGDPVYAAPHPEPAFAIAALSSPPGVQAAQVLDDSVLLVARNDDGTSVATFCADKEAPLLAWVSEMVFGEKMLTDEDDIRQAREVLDELIGCGSWYPEGDPPLFLFKLAVSAAHGGEVSDAD